MVQPRGLSASNASYGWLGIVRGPDAASAPDFASQPVAAAQGPDLEAAQPEEQSAHQSEAEPVLRAGDAPHVDPQQPRQQTPRPLSSSSPLRTRGAE